ncbi:MAG: hypothetical protein U1F67_25645 [Rubrivivax sp.]
MPAGSRNGGWRGTCSAPAARRPIPLHRGCRSASSRAPKAGCAARPVGDADDVRSYLGQTLEQTLELLNHADDDATGLYFFRLALQHDDRIAERLGHLLTPCCRRRARAARAAGRAGAALALGSARDAAAFVPQGRTRWAHEVAVPEFEIDAQCVNWAQFAEFAEDGGYDKRECWSEAGWQ